MAPGKTPSSPPTLGPTLGRHPQIARPDGRIETIDLTEEHAIRVLAPAGSGIFRDGMTVGDFLRGMPTREAALRLLARSRRAGTIGFEHREPSTEPAP